jgi:hypothetical protein
MTHLVSNVRQRLALLYAQAGEGVPQDVDGAVTRSNARFVDDSQDRLPNIGIVQPRARRRRQASRRTPPSKWT